MRFSEMLDEYLELREKGPDTSTGYTDKRYYTHMRELREGMDRLAPGIVEVSDEYHH